MSGWLILLLVLVVLAVLACIRCGIHAAYDGQELSADAMICGLHLTLLGEKPVKKSRPRKKKKEALAKVQPAEQQVGKKKNPMDLVKPFLPYWEEILAFCGRVLTSPTIDLLRVEMTVGGPDAAACANRYGRICAAFGTVHPVLQNTFQIKKQSISIEPQFQKTTLEAKGELRLSLRIYEIIVLACAALKLLLRIRRGTQNNKKAVQTQ